MFGKQVVLKSFNRKVLHIFEFFMPNKTKKIEFFENKDNTDFI